MEKRLTSQQIETLSVLSDGGRSRNVGTVVAQARDLADRERLMGRSGEAYDQLAGHVERLEAQVASLRRVLVDCHAHDVYVVDGASRADAYRKFHGDSFGRPEDVSVADHLRSVKEAADGAAAEPLLQRLAKLRAIADAAHQFVMKGGRPGRVLHLARLLGEAGYEMVRREDDR